jgi:hypothetical protein
VPAFQRQDACSFTCLLACTRGDNRLDYLLTCQFFAVVGLDVCVPKVASSLLLVGLVTRRAAAVVRARPFCLVEAALARLGLPAESPPRVQCCACACAIVKS